jgi:hypothetical protein
MLGPLLHIILVLVSIDQRCGKSINLHVDIFFLFFKTPWDESIETHFVTATTLLGILIGATGDFSLLLLV